MATEKQISANQRNAQKSTGPISAAGKASSSRNALKHGVLSQRAIADHENRKAFESLLGQLIEEYAPETALECTLVERLSLLIWREKRLAEAEAELVHQRNLLVQKVEPEKATRNLPLLDQHLIGRYQGMLGRQIRDTLKDLRDEQDRRVNSIHVANEDQG